jgi:hypothetical protein
MTGFIEVSSGSRKLLLNIASIRFIYPRDHIPGQCILRYDGESADMPTEARTMIVDHSYDDVVQLLLKTDCAAIGR